MLLHVYLFDKKLYFTGRPMFVVFNGKAYVKRVPGMNILEMLTHLESYAIEHFAGGVIHKLQFYVFQILTNELARAEIHYRPHTEHRLVVTRAKGVESP